MGHLRLGRLPLRHNWRRVVETIESPESSPPTVAAATARAAEAALKEAAASQEVTYPFWLLVQLNSMSRDEGAFAGLCHELGIRYSADMPALDLAERLTDHVRSMPAGSAGRAAFAEAALASFQRSLLDAIRDQPQSLFQAESGGLRNALSLSAGPAGFGRVSRQFLGTFFASVLRVVLSYSIAESIGPGRANSSMAEAEEFRTRLDSYARDVSRIVEEFGAGWYSKNLWESGVISKEMTAGFLHVALRKFRQQLELENL
ncbi:hypothetical protein ACFL0I_01280 [Gemmatimonadota bacterium]